MVKKRKNFDDIVFEIKVLDRNCDKYVKRKLEQWKVSFSNLDKWYKTMKKRHG